MRERESKQEGIEQEFHGSRHRGSSGGQKGIWEFFCSNGCVRYSTLCTVSQQDDIFCSQQLRIADYKCTRSIIFQIFVVCI